MQDIKTIWPGLLIAAVYCIAMTLAFGRMCPVVLITGYPCPGCGITRALVEVCRLHFHEATEYNVCVYAWIALGILFVIYRYVLKKKKFPLAILVAVSVLTVVYYIGRMLWGFPGHEPMVYRSENLLNMLSQRFGAH